MKQIKTVGVVGAGTMGAAIAQKFAQENLQVILADREMEFVQKGLNMIRNMLYDGVDKKVFTKEQADQCLQRITGTAVLADLKPCDLIVEAIYEDLEAKKSLFRTLDALVPHDTILATNTSSFSITELATSVSSPERFIGLHYFYHAAKNRLVEIIPGKNTSDEVIERARLFSVISGKDAILCKDSYGFVVNRFFVPWLNESARLLEEGVANIATIDDVCAGTFGISMGPFALMNATGVPVAYHSEKTLEVFGELYTVSNRLKEQANAKQNWDLEGEISTQEEVRKKIHDRMLGVVLFVCAQQLDENVCSISDLNKGAKIGLRWRKGPVELAQQETETVVNALVNNMAALYHMPVPKSVASLFQPMEFVRLEKKGKVAVISMDRPEDLNALNEVVMKQLDDAFSRADADKEVETIYITGTGKAFVAGADIKFFVKNIKAGAIQKIQAFTQYGQSVFSRIDHSPKKVVAVLNGMALGGGLELALCADYIVSLPKTQMSFPETGIGIYPGLGGTQRSVMKIGKGLSKYLIHTGKMISATDAFEIGLVDKIISVEEMFSLFSGALEFTTTGRKPLNDKWQNIASFFEGNSIGDLLSHQFAAGTMNPDEAEKIFKTVQRKAPVAISIADKLIDEAKGCDSELSYLAQIFSTEDALLGLTSIGKQVAFQGK